MKAAVKIEYFPEDHIYKVNGIEKLSVNKVLKAEGAMPDFDRFPNSEYKRQLGIYLHSAIKMYFENTLDESSLTGELRDYFNGFLKFHNDYPISPLEVEKPLYSEKHDFCGTPDCFTSVLYDWKASGYTYPHYLLTMGAYSLLLEENGYKIEEVQLVHITPNNYKIEKIIPDKTSFLAFLYAYKWKAKKLKEVGYGTNKTN